MCDWLLLVTCAKQPTELGSSTDSTVLLELTFPRSLLVLLQFLSLSLQKNYTILLLAQNATAPFHFISKMTGNSNTDVVFNFFFFLIDSMGPLNG